MPIDGQMEAGTQLLTDHKLKLSKTLRELVELGPKALPFLLKALDDRAKKSALSRVTLLRLTSRYPPFTYEPYQE